MVNTIVSLDGGKTYFWLKSLGVTHRMMRELSSPGGLNFYKNRHLLGKSVGQVPPENIEVVLKWFEKNGPKINPKEWPRRDITGQKILIK